MDVIVRRALRAAELAREAWNLATQKEGELTELLVRMTDEQAAEYVAETAKKGL